MVRRAGGIGIGATLNRAAGVLERLGREKNPWDYSIRGPLWPAGAGQGRNAALSPPYSAC
ncbi:hypothetical protein GCM10010987_67520 [Bradyrhizobium guangdongense]|uniref:Uncharacterized protein n=1 Tax=Bradyrhizobium guangdongense TaxID=1325090 RepID=A0AA88BC32_9BRAD|nr:hypothetical protein GCM10010987_67520 [Bradyrhizobium guangdongense]